jgi:membrane associated rhomboid family serine protease
MTESTAPARKGPSLRLPPLVALLAALALVALYAAFVFAPIEEQNRLDRAFALNPGRFWAPAGSPSVYDSHAAGLLTLLSTALLHLDWFHVIINSLMVLMFGAPVARALGLGILGTSKWMLLFVVSIIAGSAFYLALATVESAPAIGASGGTCGLIAAAFLLDFDGRKRRLWSREFLIATAVFAALNAILTWLAPQIGLYLGWEAHVGGYVAGALLMAVLPLKGYGGAKA